MQIHGGSSGIGTFAIQIAKYYGARVFVTAGIFKLIAASIDLALSYTVTSVLIFRFAGSEEKLAACKDLGADVCINYKTEDFVARVKEETAGKGASCIFFVLDIDQSHQT